MLSLSDPNHDRYKSPDIQISFHGNGDPGKCEASTEKGNTCSIQGVISPIIIHFSNYYYYLICFPLL